MTVYRDAKQYPLEFDTHCWWCLINVFDFKASYATSYATVSCRWFPIDSDFFSNRIFFSKHYKFEHGLPFSIGMLIALMNTDLQIFGHIKPIFDQNTNPLTLVGLHYFACVTPQRERYRYQHADPAPTPVGGGGGRLQYKDVCVWYLKTDPF